MKPKKLTGTQIPRFTYDTPFQAENDFYQLCAGKTPLVMVFLSNFGHPISRAYLGAYLQTVQSLQAGRLACVVRSNPQVIAECFDEASFPFTIICDAEGVLYDYFEVRETTSMFDWTFAARRIIKEAEKEGYVHDKKAPQLLPLTLVMGSEGQVLYAHRARSLTDLPEDCDAIDLVCAQLSARLAKQQGGEVATQEEEVSSLEAFTAPEGQAEPEPEQEPLSSAQTIPVSEDAKPVPEEAQRVSQDTQVVQADAQPEKSK